MTNQKIEQKPKEYCDLTLVILIHFNFVAQ